MQFERPILAGKRSLKEVVVVSVMVDYETTRFGTEGLDLASHSLRVVKVRRALSAFRPESRSSLLDSSAQLACGTERRFAG